MKVEDVMTKGSFSCTAESTARDALALMWKRDVGALPVVDGDSVIGMITDRDIAMAAWMHDAPPSALCVGDIITRQVWSVAPGGSVAHAEEVMEEHQVRRLPVVDRGRLVGIVSLADLARARTKVPSEEVAQTLAAITEPRVPPEAVV